MTEPVDYTRLVDAETWGFIRQTERWYPVDTAEKPIQEQREIYDRMCREFYACLPALVVASDRDANGVPIRHYCKSDSAAGPLVLYFHGGGFVVGGLDSHDDVCAEICDFTGLDVVSVDYRLCPENPHPAAFEDAQTALGWARATVAPGLIFAGDSAGGNLAAALAHANRGGSDILGQVLIYPGLGGDRERGSYQQHRNAPMLSLSDIEFYDSVRQGGADVTGDARYAPLWDDDFTGLPPTLVFGAECDPLADDARDYADAITAAGGQAKCYLDRGLVHGHLRARHTVRRARNSFDRVLRGLKMLGQGNGISSIV